MVLGGALVLGVVVAAVTLSACGSGTVVRTGTPGTTAPAQGVDQPPRPADVGSGRFVHAAELDGGGLKVSPAPGGTHPALGQHEAAVLFGSDSSVYGQRTQHLLGFGVVSVKPGLGVDVRRAPAWLGLVWGGATSCPAMTAPTGSTTSTVEPPTPGYRAVIIIDSRQVFDYRSRGSACGEPATGPDARAASEILSTPWRLVSLQASAVTVRYRAPACLPQVPPEPSISGSTRTGQASLTIEMILPFDRPSCADLWRQTTVSFAPPLGPGAPPPPHFIHIAHGATGPTGEIQPIV